METLYQGMSIGVIATIGQDLWEVICQHVFRLPTGDIALVGRWPGHVPRGVLVHHAISESTAISKERWIGWIAHYVTGIVYGVTDLGIVRILPLSDPTLLSALVFALACLVAPWCIVQPAMGAGIFASRTPRPWKARLVSLSMHVAFGISLYGAWLLIGLGSAP